MVERRFDVSFKGGPRVPPVRARDVTRHLFPVLNLLARVRIRRVVCCACRDGLAVEVLELCRQLADDSRLALRRQSRKAQALANERLPVTHR